VSDLDLCYMSATEALALFRARKLSPVELMKAVIARAGAVNKKVNAFTFTHFDEALDLALRKSEQRELLPRVLAAAQERAQARRQLEQGVDRPAP